MAAHDEADKAIDDILVGGQFDYVAQMVCADLDRYNAITNSALRGDPGVTGGDMEPTETIAWHEIIHQGELHDWRAAQLIRLGFPRPLAEAVADHVDWHEIAALVRRGCGPRLALNIVL